MEGVLPPPNTGRRGIRSSLNNMGGLIGLPRDQVMEIEDVPEKEVLNPPFRKHLGKSLKLKKIKRRIRKMTIPAWFT